VRTRWPMDAALPFHAQLPGYAATPLRPAPSLARSAGLEQVWVKDESHRLGLPAFKILGSSWATARAFQERFGLTPEGWSELDSLRLALAAATRPPAGGVTLVTASDGNHGRAVARVARWVGANARIHLPRGTAEARVDAIAREGAAVLFCDGDHAATVRQAARDADAPGSILVQDTSWPGQPGPWQQISRWIVQGYGTLFAEMARGCEPDPDMVLLPVGVGSLAAAAVVWYHARAAPPPRLVAVEPVGASCALASLRAGKPVTVPGPHRSSMVGLDCGELSSLAWPLLRRGLDAAVETGDERVAKAVELLQRDGIVAGESGAAAAAGLLELAAARLIGEGSVASAALPLSSSRTALVLVTEGITDPARPRPPGLSD